MSFISSVKCVLVLGATSGIGRDLALAIHDLPSKPTVIVAGRREHRLNEILARGSKLNGTANLHALTVDVMSDVGILETFVNNTLTEFPNLDAIIFSSGVQHVVNFKKPESISLDVLRDEFTTNYTSVLTLIKLFLPHFFKLNDAGRPSFMVPISSGLAFQPFPSVAGYCATKAAVHSLFISLRAQLRDTKIQVIEIAPPLVESELHDHQGRDFDFSKMWMPLSEFTPKVMQGLEQGNDVIPVGACAHWHAKYEEGKQEVADEMHKKGV